MSNLATNRRSSSFYVEISDSIPPAEVRRLRRQAIRSGDQDIVMTCDIALAGRKPGMDKRAQQELAGAIAVCCCLVAGEEGLL